jgi:hypothetical protein
MPRPSKDTPIEKVQKSNIEEKIKKVGLLDWLSETANVSSAFYQLVTSSYVQQAIALLSK